MYMYTRNCLIDYCMHVLVLYIQLATTRVNIREHVYLLAIVSTTNTAEAVPATPN